MYVNIKTIFFFIHTLQLRTIKAITVETKKFQFDIIRTMYKFLNGNIAPGII